MGKHESDVKDGVGTETGEHGTRECEEDTSDQAVGCNAAAGIELANTPETVIRCIMSISVIDSGVGDQR